jgi:hypothetical protein
VPARRIRTPSNGARLPIQNAKLQR